MTAPARAAAAASLKSFIERIEAIAADRRDLGDDMRAVFAEAKAEGFDTKAMRRITMVPGGKRADDDDKAAPDKSSNPPEGDDDGEGET